MFGNAQSSPAPLPWHVVAPVLQAYALTPPKIREGHGLDVQGLMENADAGVRAALAKTGVEALIAADEQAAFVAVAVLQFVVDAMTYGADHAFHATHGDHDELLRLLSAVGIGLSQRFVWLALHHFGDVDPGPEPFGPSVRVADMPDPNLVADRKEVDGESERP